jgi:hypothetical protein
MNSHSKELVVRLIPVATFICATVVTMFVGSRYEFIGVYKRFLYVHGYVEGNVAFYFAISLYVMAYPLFKNIVPKVTLFLFVAVMAFFAFQIEYALMTTTVTKSLGLVAKDDVSYINIGVAVFVLAVVLLVLSRSPLSRNTILIINGILSLSALLATYHTYALLVSVGA